MWVKVESGLITTRVEWNTEHPDAEGDPGV